MPQEFHVLQCFSCQMFQVDIVKNVQKWSCKLCGEKQSIKKIFATGTGKECRIVVQSLNADRISKETQNEFVSSSSSTSFPFEPETVNNTTNSKWGEFLEDTEPPERVAPADTKCERQSTINPQLSPKVQPKVSIFEDHEETDLKLNLDL